MIQQIIISKRRRHGNDNDDVKLSDLPDCILIYIMSFLNTIDAVRTCVLSKRWKHIWKHIPILTLHYSDFSTLKCFHKFVSRVLSLRDNSVLLQSIDFDGNGGCIQSSLLKRFSNYVLSHNAQLNRLGFDVKGDICHIF